jgi:GTP cyclohydrolase FolE2
LRVVGRDGAVQTTVASAEMTVGLAPEVKGTHMSRFVDILTSSTEPLSPAGLVRMAEQVRWRLQSVHATLSVQFPYFLRREAPVTGCAAPVDYEARLSASAGDVARLEVGVRTPITSLCPCSKEISDYGAHSQRGHVEITAACDPLTPVWLEDLVAVAEDAGSAPVYSLLKRVDEREVTMRAY